MNDLFHWPPIVPHPEVPPLPYPVAWDVLAWIMGE